MGDIFTRESIAQILQDEALSDKERLDQVFGLYGRSVNEGYVSKKAAQAAQSAAIDQAKAEWEAGLTPPDIKASDEYKALQGEFDAYRAMQTARASDDFRGVKPKFFETVYGMIDRGDGAKPVKEQLDGIRQGYEEYFTPDSQEPAKPQFGARTAGSMPTGQEGAAAEFAKAWGFVPRK